MLLNLHSLELDTLKSLGFSVNPLNSQANNLTEVWQYYLKIEKERLSLNYPIDGLVVKLNSNLLLEKLGVVGKTPRAWSALKFQALEVATQVIDVDYQIGRTGKITPVVNITPTLIQGTTVKRASLHNIQELVDLNLHTQDTLIIRKAGDIIPEVVSLLVNLRIENSKKITIPTNCPSCGTLLLESKTKIDLICPNKLECKDQIKLRLAYYCARPIANIDGLSEKTIEKMISTFNLRTIADLYLLDLDKLSLIDGFKEKSINNLKEGVQKASQISDFKFLTGLGIEGIGLENAKTIAKYINDLPAD
jgi:DNA ligase (NAD+)